MLPSDRRIRTSAQFRSAVRGGRRAGRPSLVVHLLHEGAGRQVPAEVPPVAAGPAVTAASTELDARTGDTPPRAGFVVSRAVGGAVVRNRVRRRLRELVRSRLDALPERSLLVVRALPAAAEASSSVLAHDLDSALRRVGDRAADGRSRSADGGASARPRRPRS